jgi:soluble lytic murein transglycosylase-like protein
MMTALRIAGVEKFHNCGGTTSLRRRAGGPSRRYGPGGRGFLSLPVLSLAILASLGFGHTEAGILHDNTPSDVAPAASQSDIALRSLQIERRERVRAFAKGFAIERQLAERIYDAAVNEGVIPELAFRLVKVESSFRQRAIGPAGSIGYTQVQPRTARWMDPSVSREDLFEVETNLRIGFRYLKMMQDRYRDTRLALLAYNRGPGTVTTVLATGEDPANGYARRVLGVNPAR